MSPKEYLYRIRNLKLEVEATKNELLELKASMDGVRAIDTTKKIMWMAGNPLIWPM